MINIIILFIIIFGLLISLYFLRNDFILAFFMWAVLLVPYIIRTESFNIRGSYIIIPIILAYLIYKLFGYRKLYAINNKFIIVLLFYLFIMTISVIFNEEYLLKSSYTSYALFFIISLFYLLYSEHSIRIGRTKLIDLGNKVFYVLIWFALVAIVVGLLEIIYPEEIKYYYSPEIDIFLVRQMRDDFIFSKLYRSNSIIGSPNALGSFLLIGAISSLSYSFVYKKPTYVLLSIIFILSIALLSLSRGALVACIFAIIMMLIYFKKYIILTLTLLLSISIYYVIPNIMSIFFKKHDIYYGVQYITGISALDERLFFWLEGIRTIFDKPEHILYGYGPSNIVLLNTINVKTGHNILISAVHYYGILGLLLLFIMICLILYYQYKLVKNNHDSISNYYVVTLLFVTIGLLVHSLFDNVLFFDNIITYIYFPLISICINDYDLATRYSNIAKIE